MCQNIPVGIWYLWKNDTCKYIDCFDQNLPVLSLWLVILARLGLNLHFTWLQVFHEIFATCRLLFVSCAKKTCQHKVRTDLMVNLLVLVYGFEQNGLWCIKTGSRAFFHQGAPMSSDPQSRIQTSKSHFQVSEEVQEP